MLKFKNFELASASKSYEVEGDIYNTNRVSLPHILEKIQAEFSEDAKEEAVMQKQKLEDLVKMEVANSDFTTFGEYDGRMYMFLVNSNTGFSDCIKVNKKRPAKFKGHACNIQDTTPLFAD